MALIHGLGGTQADGFGCLLSRAGLTAGTMFPELLRAVERLNGEFERAPLPVGCAFGQLTATADQVLARMD